MRPGTLLVVLAFTLSLARTCRGGAAPPSELPVVVIVTTSAVEAFDEATEGIRHSLGPAPKVVIVDLASNAGDLTSQLRGKEVRLLVSVGNNALEAAARYGTAPILATMLLEADLKSSRLRPPAGGVVLDLALGDVMSGLGKVFPGKLRAGMIRNPEASSTSVTELVSEAKAAGISLRVVDCPRPEKLLQVFRSLQGLVDFVWCPPDGTLYNGTTVKPLILASLENHLPVAGFSASFVRAGAAAGVYPDYSEIGTQAGELARKYLSGNGAMGIEGPHKIRIAANTRVARLLGLRLTAKGEMDSGIVVIE
jgi:putative tryptophan/tyrosine transport system substrate-binding protein